MATRFCPNNRKGNRSRKIEMSTKIFLEKLELKLNINLISLGCSLNIYHKICNVTFVDKNAFVIVKYNENWPISRIFQDLIPWRIIYLCFCLCTCVDNRSNIQKS